MTASAPNTRNPGTGAVHVMFMDGGGMGDGAQDGLMHVAGSKTAGVDDVNGDGTPDIAAASPCHRRRSSTIYGEWPSL